MRIILRGHQSLTRQSRTGVLRFPFSNVAQGGEISEAGEMQLHKQSEKKYTKQRSLFDSKFKPESNFEFKDFDEVLRDDKDRLQVELNDVSQERIDYNLEGPWAYVAPHLMIDSYQLLTPFDRQQAAKAQVAEYENSLQLTLGKHLFPKLYDEGTYFRKMAKYHLSEMPGLTPSFLRQGYNFLDKKVLLHMITHNKIKLLKEVMSASVFDSVNYIDGEIIQEVLDSYQKDPRNEFMLNLLPLERELVFGIKPVKLHPSISEEFLMASRNDLFSRIIYNMQSSKSINKLRFLWGCQRSYLYKHHLYEHINTELKKLRFTSSNPSSQTEINKQVSSVLSSAFSGTAMMDFYYKLMELAKTYDIFIKSYSLAIILLSKLKSITSILSQDNCTELHHVFQFIEVNLPKKVACKLMKNLIFELLLHEEHNWMHQLNYDRCLDFWQIDTSLPASTSHHSALSKIVEDCQIDFTVVYQAEDDVEEYARSVVKLNKNEVARPSKQPKSQARIINDLLKGDYQSVLDDFLVRYSLPADFDLNRKFLLALKNVDKTLTFHSKQQESLYKLKMATHFFFTQASTDPLEKDHFNIYKQNLEVAANLHTPLFRGEQLLSQKQMLRVNQKERQIEDNILADFNIQVRNQRSVENNIKPRKDQNQVNTDRMAKEQQQEEEVSDDLEISMPVLNSNSAQEMFELEKDDPMGKYLEKMLIDLETNNIIDRKELSEINQLSLEKARERLMEVYNQYKEVIDEQVAQQTNEPEQEFISHDSELEAILKEEKERKIKGLSLPKDQEDFTMTAKCEELLQHYQHVEEPNLLFDNIESEMIEQEMKEKSEFNKPLFGKKNNVKEVDLDQEMEKDSEYQSFKNIVEFNSLENLDEYLSKDEESSTDIDGARDDRAIHHAFDRLFYEPSRPQVHSRSTEAVSVEEEEDIEIEADDPQSKDLNQSEVRLFRSETKIVKQIYTSASNISYEETYYAGIVLDQMEKIYCQKSQGYNDKDLSGELPERSEWKAVSKVKKPLFGRNKDKKPKATFCTVKEIVKQHEENPFVLEKIEQYRKKSVSQEFFDLMKSESHIPQIGEGLTIAKYLFLHSKRKDKKMKVDSSRQLSIEFTSVVGTRAKSYEPYLTNTLYPYELEDSFYESILQDQVGNYNRHQFKQILAHMFHFKSNLTDKIVGLICQLCQQHRTGYSFIEIVHFIKANNISISETALENLTKTWHRFTIINEDMLPFVRQYCKTVDMPFKTSYYIHFCASLIKNGQFEKLEALCGSVLSQIKPKPFRVTSTMSINQVPVLQKIWKEKEIASYVQLYLELMEVIVSNLNTKIPTFLLSLFIDYLKLRPDPTEKELAYGFVCSATSKQKFLTLLTYLEKHPQLGTEFMYDCLMQSMLSNLRQLEEYCERILDSTVFINRLVLNNERIMKTLLIFKRSNSTNSFSKFLEHCLRFQEEITKNDQLKKEMFYILNSKIEDVSITGIFNLLDFIFNSKREEERVMYRQIKNNEEEKERKLAQILAKTSDGGLDGAAAQEAQATVNAKNESDDEKHSHNNSEGKAQKQKSSKKQVKKAKKDKSVERKATKQMASQILAEMEMTSPQKTKQFNVLNDDEEMISVIKQQSLKHVSKRRKGVQSFGQLYKASIEVQKIDEQEVDEKGKKHAKRSKK